MQPQLKIKILREGVELPRYHSDGAAGIDLCCCDDLRFIDRDWLLANTGIAVQIPCGYEGQVRGRSSLAMRGYEVFLGTIDSDYTGEIRVIVRSSIYGGTIAAGTRIAQLVIAPVARCEIVQVDELSKTARGEGGFGSTGS